MAFKFNPLTGQFDLVESGSSVQTPNYSALFNATTDWGAPSAGSYEISIPALTHGKGINPIVQVYELVGSDYEKVTATIDVAQANGDIILSVSEVPDTRFEGKIVIAENN